ncbi:MAG: PorV/PorQ family protein, partial [Bacteroidota bacterium]|nr:PorV/PorQ family protein [Bacteroidota bacterium]
LSSCSVWAGNEDRAGSAGATDLLINPWARSSAWGSAGLSSVNGLEAVFLNVAGLAYADQTEVQFCRTNWMGNISGIGLNSAGLAQRVGEAGVLGISFVSLNYGDIEITTTALPEGGIGYFNPSSTNFTVSYAKKFSSSISGGMNLKVVSQSISNVSAQGVAIDAGIRYVTGDQDNIKFAISLKNVGPPMSYSGDGLSLDMLNPSTSLSIGMVQRSSSFEMPSQLSIGTSYDFIFSENSVLTAAGSFSANSFSRDQFHGGLKWKVKTDKASFGLMGGFVYEQGIFNADEMATALSGPCGGFSFEFPFGDSGSNIGINYAYRQSVLGGIHTVGGRINIGN